MMPVRWRETMRCGCCGHRLFAFEPWVVTEELETLCGVCRAWARNAMAGRPAPLDDAVWQIVESHLLAGPAGYSAALAGVPHAA